MFGDDTTQPGSPVSPDLMSRLLMLKDLVPQAPGANAPVMPPSVPASAPASAPTGDVGDIGALVKAQVMEQLKRARGVGDVGTAAAEAPMPEPPKYGYHPNMERVTGAGSLFRDIGRALLTIGASTGPGEAIQSTIYGPGIRRYEAEKAARAQRVGEIQRQQGLEQQPMGELGSLAWHAGQLELGSEKNRILQQRADTAAQAVLLAHNDRLIRLTQGAQALGIKERTQQLNEWYKRAYIDAYNARTGAGVEVGMARTEAMRDVAAAMQQNKIVQENPVWSQVLKSLDWMPNITVPTGTSTEPTKPGVPAGAPAGKLSAPPPAAGAERPVYKNGKIIGYTTDGKTMRPARQ